MRTVKEIINFVLRRERLFFYERSSSFLTSKRTKVRADLGFTASCQEEKAYFLIVLGSLFAEKYFEWDLKEEIPDYNLAKKKLSILEKIYNGLFQHEVGHILFTNFKTHNRICKLINKKKATAFLNIYLTLNNLVEDFYLESKLEEGIVFKSLDIEFLNESMMTIERYQTFVDNIDHLDVLKTLLVFLSYQFCNPSSITFVPIAYVSLREFISRSLNICLETNDSALRLRRVLSFAYQLISFLLDDKHVVDYKWIIKGFSDEDIENLPEEICNSFMNSAYKKPDHFFGSEEEIETSGEGIRGEGVGASGCKGEDEMEYFNSFFNGLELSSENERHDYFDTSSLLIAGKYNKHKGKILYDLVHKSVEPLIFKLVDSIEAIKANNYTRYLSGFSTGKKIKGSKVLNPMNYKVMSRKLSKKDEADLSFTFLIDQSSSMGSDRRMASAKSYVALAEACYLLRIPTSAYYFTWDGHVATTVCFKNFHDDFNETKHGISATVESISNDFHPLGLPIVLTGGNVDEVNLDFVWKHVKSSSINKDNIIIVLSDGVTCGSVTRLTSVVNEASKNNIHCYAIGMFSNAVSRSYKDYTVITTNSDLDNLPILLLEYFKKKFLRRD